MSKKIEDLRARVERCLDGVIDKDVVGTILFGFDRACGLAKEEGRQSGLKIAIDRLVKHKNENGGVDIASEIIALHEHLFEEGGEDPRITYMRARTVALESDGALISISADGLDPELEALMWETIERFRVAVSAEPEADTFPALIIYPDKETAEASCRDRIQPMITIPAGASDEDLELLKLQLEVQIKTRAVAKLEGLQPDNDDD